MTCPVCGAENEAPATFCFRCGARLQPAAPATGPTVSLRPGDTPPVGMPVAERVPPAESSSAPIAGPTNTAPRVYMVPSPGVPAGVSPPLSNNATISLVLGIVGLLAFFVLLCVSFGTLSVLAAAVGIPAAIVGRNARREIRASNGRLGGDGAATAGIVLGWITIGLSAVTLIILVAVFGGLVLFAS